MIRLCLIFMILFIACPDQASSQTSTYVDDDGKHTVAWDNIAGSIVEFDGIAWGAMEKGLGEHVLTTRGQKIYLNNVDLFNSDLNGRLIRVAGVLRKVRMEPAPKGAQGYTQPFDYFTVDTVAASRIDKVVLDQVLPSESDWIVPGLASETALELIAARNLQPYLLALAAAKDGSETHSYLASEGVVVVFRVLDGRVASVSQLRLNEMGKLDDEWVQIRGFKLPATGFEGHDQNDR